MSYSFFLSCVGFPAARALSYEIEEVPLYSSSDDEIASLLPNQQRRDSERAKGSALQKRLQLKARKKGTSGAVSVKQKRAERTVRAAAALTRERAQRRAQMKQGQGDEKSSMAALDGAGDKEQEDDGEGGKLRRSRGSKNKPGGKKRISPLDPRYLEQVFTPTINGSKLLEQGSVKEGLLLLAVRASVHLLCVIGTNGERLILLGVCIHSCPAGKCFKKKKGISFHENYCRCLYRACRLLASAY